MGGNLVDLDQLKQCIDLHDLAAKLGLVRPHETGNYRSPHHPDSSPSLSIFQKNGEWGWKDWSQDIGGTCIDLVMHVRNLEAGEAIKWLRATYGLQSAPQQPGAPRERSRAEFVAAKCLENPEPAIAYLVGRKITEEMARRAVQKKAVGWNTYISTKKQPGEPGYGGPGCAFVVTSMNPGRVMAVDVRYVDPQLNGGVKTQCQGEKEGYPWFVDLASLKKAHTVYVVESPINALSVESCGMPPGVVALATRGVGTVDSIDWRCLAGKHVRLCMDNDAPDDKGRMPGQNAAWKIYERLTALNIPALLVEQGDWEHNDVNDILQQAGPDELRQVLKRLEPWLIPGLAGTEEFRKLGGKMRIFLPAHDFAQYWRFRVKDDFTTWVTKSEKDEEAGVDRESFEDVCGFRVAGITRVTVASVAATMGGGEDHAPRTLFAVSVQSPLFEGRLVRKVLDDESIHNVDQWRKFGLIFKPAPFSRMLAIMYRTAGLGSRKAANFVGLCWMDGKPVVNEGPDCYFTEPDKQCPYHGLTFPAGSPADARLVISEYQKTFRKNAAAIILVWGLGAHLKAFMEFWPHAIVQASKGAGKSTLIARMERTLAFQMFSGQSLQTEFRLVTSVSHTSHPVGWEEISARRQDVIDKAVSLLQESYKFTVTRRGADMTEYLISAPVLLAGEDVPVRSLFTKVIRTDLTERMGPLLPDNLPVFPVRDWLRHLTQYTRQEIRERYDRALEYCRKHCRASGKDAAARRMVENYAAVLTAWGLLCDWLDLDRQQGGFTADTIEAMNSHIEQSSGDREPWVWIMEVLLHEIAQGTYRLPYKVDQDDTGRRRLLVRPAHIMHHIKTAVSLRDVWNGLPVKSDRVLKQQLTHAGVVLEDRVDATIKYQREYHLMALSVEELEKYGMHVSFPEEPNV